MNYYTIGLDPGFSGGITILERRGTSLKIFLSFPMPIKILKDRKEIDAKLLYETLKDFSPTHPLKSRQRPKTLAVIEDVAAMPGQGVVSMFRFGYGAGVLWGVLAALDIPTIKIKPQVWKGVYALSPDKNDSVRLANRLLEPLTPFTIKTEAQAEAALLAHFGATRLQIAVGGSPAPFQTV